MMQYTKATVELHTSDKNVYGSQKEILEKTIMMFIYKVIKMLEIWLENNFLLTALDTDYVIKFGPISLFHTNNFVKQY